MIIIDDLSTVLITSQSRVKSTALITLRYNSIECYGSRVHFLPALCGGYCLLHIYRAIFLIQF